MSKAGLVLASLLAAACLAPPSGARTLHTVLQDDPLSLFSPRALPAYTQTLRWLGVDYVRISAEWKLEAPTPDASRPPGAFAAADPSAYTAPGMKALDRAVIAAARAGLAVIIDPAFSAPRWATDQRAAAAGSAWYKAGIDLRELVLWETMLARRYSGRFVPAGSRRALPPVQAFTLWNEPNEQGYLSPQWRDGVPVSADWYRWLVMLAYPAIKQAAPRALVLIGNTSSTGGDSQSSAGGVPPLVFIRRLACVDERLRPVHDGGCADFRTVPADGYSHHPYERDAPPWIRSSPALIGAAQMGDLPQLQRLLDRLVAMRRLARGAASVWLTEQGYESNGELRDRPWSESQQAQWNAVSEYLAWRDPQVASFSQFLLRDTRTRETLALRARLTDPRALLAGTWTTGLEREDGAPKPALWMFRTPIVARVASPPRVACTLPWLSRRHGSEAVRLVEVWGRIRPARRAAAVRVEAALAGSSPPRLVRAASTDPNGIFDVRVVLPASASVQVRFSWRQADGGWSDSPMTRPLEIDPS